MKTRDPAPEAVRGWSLGGDWGVRFYTDFGGRAPNCRRPKFKTIRSSERSGTHQKSSNLRKFIN